MASSAHSGPGLRALAGALVSGEMELHAYLDHVCDRIDRAEPHIAALLPEPDRRERLHREATALLRGYPEPQRRPPLFGVPVGVKDIFRVDGFQTRSGSALPPELFAGPEAPLVTRLKEGGALILGKTVTTEFAYFEPGPTRNPHATDHTPGGSSSGSAAAIAAGYCPLALGSQTVGSIVRPAAFCGVAGFKPTYGLLSLEGVIPYAPSLDHAGFFVPVAADLPYGLSAAAGIAPVDTPRWSAAIPEGPYLDQADTDTLSAFRGQIETLRAAGFRIGAIPALADITEIIRRHNVIAAAEMAAVHRDWFAQHGRLYRPRTAAWIREGQQFAPEAVEAARSGRARLREELHRLMGQHDFKAWLSPAACGPAPEGTASTGDPAMNFPWTHAGLPTAVVPAGRAWNGLPLGLQITARWGEDAALAAFAAAAGEVLRSVELPIKMNLNTLQSRPPVA